MADHSPESLAAAIGGYGAESYGVVLPPPSPEDDLFEKWKPALGEPVRAGNQVEALVDGPETYRAMYNALRTTLDDDGKEYYIYLLTWWLDEDVKLEPNDRESSLLDLIRLAAKNDVQVRLMIWDNTFKWLERLDPRVGPWNERVRVLTHQHKKLNALGPNVASIRDGNNLERQSHHQKVLVVKGSEGLIGFCGGVDIAHDRIEPMRHHTGSPFHDVHCRIVGPAVHDLVNVFMQRWRAHPDHEKIDREKGALRGVLESFVPAKPQPRGDKHVAIRRTFVRRDPQSEKGCAEELSIASTLLSAIRSARRFIYIEDQYLVGFEIANALGEALKNNDDLKHVTILIPHSAISDLPNVWEGRWEFLRRIAEKIPDTYRCRLRTFFKYVPAKGHESPGSVLKKDDFGPGSYVHSKVWIFDDELAVIGSANCNRRGWTYDSETNAFIFDCPPPGATSFAHALRMRLWAKHLHLSEDEVRHPIKAADLWVKPEAAAYVRPYNPHEQTDSRDWWVPIRPRLRDNPPPEPLPAKLTEFDERLGPTHEDHSWNSWIDPSLRKFDHCKR